MLKIPVYSQERWNTCGLAALRMVLAYHDDFVSESALEKEVELHSFGTFMTDLGVIALKRSYIVTCFTMRLSLIASLKLSIGAKITKQILAKTQFAPRDRVIFQSWEWFLSAGGSLWYGIPQLEQLQKNTDNKLPCIVSANTALLGKYGKRWDNGHYFVVNGYQKNTISVLDPDEPEKKAMKKFNSDIFSTAWIMNAVLSSSYLLIVEK